MTPLTIAEATLVGHREALVAVRKKLADEMDASPGARDLAGLAKQLTDVLDKIAALDGPAKPAEVSVTDEFSQRLAARRAGASAS
jgi:hypothetical protein